MSSSLPNTVSWEWAGQRLNSPIAISLFTAPRTRTILFVGVADSLQSKIVSPGRFGEFLRQHADCTFVCENAADFHWTIHDDAPNLENTSRIREILWRMSAAYRLLDIQLFEQLIKLAETGEETAARPLADLLQDFCQSSWKSPEQIAIDAIPFREIQRFPPDLVTRACNVASSLMRLYNALALAADAAAQNSSESTANSLYGPLGLGIQVQARIALEKPRPNPIVYDEGAADVIAWLEQEIERQTPNIRRLSRLKDCLKWEQDHLVSRNDFPEIDADELRALLVSVAGELIGPDGVPFPYVVDLNGKKSINDQDWGVLSQSEAHLRAWCQLSAAAQQLHFIRRYRGQPIVINYSIVPRIQPRPRGAILGGLIGRGLLRRPEGGQQSALTFDRLELRALASWCEHRFGNSTLAAAYRNGDDPIRQLAERLATNHRSFPQGDDQRMAAARLLLTSIGLKFGRPTLGKLVDLELNQTIDPPTVANWEDAAFELFPELRRYRDDVADRLAANLHIRRTTIEQELQPCSDFAAIGAQVLGMRPLGPAYHNLTDLITDPQLKIQAWNRSDTASLYEQLFGRAFRTPTGRIRGKCGFAEGNAEYLDLADDAMKAAMFALTASGLEIVAVADRTVLVWTGDHVDERSLETSASAAAERLLHVPVEISIKGI